MERYFNFTSNSTNNSVKWLRNRYKQLESKTKWKRGGWTNWLSLHVCTVLLKLFLQFTRFGCTLTSDRCAAWYANKPLQLFYNCFKFIYTSIVILWICKLQVRCADICCMHTHYSCIDFALFCWSSSCSLLDFDSNKQFSFRHQQVCSIICMQTYASDASTTSIFLLLICKLQVALLLLLIRKRCTDICCMKTHYSYMDFTLFC